jgi:putative FmdB family regulatory protein
MPVYEYRCRACGRKSSLLVGMVAEPDDETCPACGSHDLERLVSRFRRGRTEDDRLDELADRMETIPDPESAAETRTLLREVGKAMDEDFADEMEEMYEADMENPDDGG